MFSDSLRLRGVLPLLTLALLGSCGNGSSSTPNVDAGSGGAGSPGTSGSGGAGSAGEQGSGGEPDGGAGSAGAQGGGGAGSAGESGSSGSSAGGASGGQGGSSGAAGAAGAASGASGASGSGPISGDTEHAWALWPMPNPVVAALPNPHDYTVMNVSGEWIVQDNVTGLVWSQVDTDEITWDAARAHCANLVYAGQDDWRMPSRIELVSLVDYARVTPASDPTAFPDMADALYWTSSPTPADPSRPFVVDFADGDTRDDLAGSNTNRVRCVR